MQQVYLFSLIAIWIWPDPLLPATPYWYHCGDTDTTHILFSSIHIDLFCHLDFCVLLHIFLTIFSLLWDYHHPCLTHLSNLYYGCLPPLLSLSGFSRETESIGCVQFIQVYYVKRYRYRYVDKCSVSLEKPDKHSKERREEYIGRFITRNWLIKTWGLSSKICRLSRQAGETLEEPTFQLKSEGRKNPMSQFKGSQ